MTRTPWDLFIDTLTMINTALIVGVIYTGMAVHPPTPGPGPGPNPQPNPPPPPASTSLARAAKIYHDGLGPEFIDAAKQVRTGQIAGPPALKVYLDSHAKPFAATLTETAKAYQSVDGKSWADAESMATELQAAGVAMGAK